MTEFLTLGELGRGTHGVVYKVRELTTGETYALKRVSLSTAEPLREVAILQHLDHPHIVKFHGWFKENGAVHILMEYAAKGDLQQFVSQQREKGQRIPETDIWKWAHQIVQALKYLHSKKILHRDLKCLNVLLSAGGIAKLGDLGASKVAKTGRESTRVGTPMYLAPELVKQQPYDFKADLWGLGCVLYSLCCLEPPFKGDTVSILNKNILSATPKPLPPGYSPRLNDLICKCLRKLPEKRISLEEVEQFFQKEKPIILPRYRRSSTKPTSQLSTLEDKAEEESLGNSTNRARLFRRRVSVLPSIQATSGHHPKVAKVSINDLKAF